MSPSEKEYTLLQKEGKTILPTLKEHAFSITKTRLCKYVRKFYLQKLKKIQIKTSDTFSYFCSKHRL